MSERDSEKGVIMNNDSHKTETGRVRKEKSEREGEPQLKLEETCKWNEMNKRPTHTHRLLW